MAYQYPSAEPSSSTVSLVPGPAGSSKHPSKLGPDSALDVFREFRYKIEEDDTYISFFSERIQAEETYIKGLKRMHDRSVAVDSLHDDAGAPKRPVSSTRRAWKEVRDHTLREIEAREAMVGALKGDMIKELVKLKEEQSRIRQNLRDNMKLADQMYDDHVKNQVPKLKRTYFARCQAVEDHKRQEHAIQMQAKLLSESTSTSPVSTPLQEHPNAWTSPQSTAFSPPTATGPLPPSTNPALPSGPIEPYERSTSIAFSPSVPTLTPKLNIRNRDRAGSTSAAKDTKEMFTDLAQQSKKGFNAIMQKLGGDKSDKEREGDFVVLGSEDAPPTGLKRSGTARGDPARGMGTMRGVRLKRDADEADKAYRLGVFHLESLRLRREKLQSSAFKNIETFSDELNACVSKTLQTYVDVLHGTAATNGSATQVARSALDSINAERDMSLYRTTLGKMDIQHTAAVPYTNFYVGDCRSLIFGVSLTDYDFARGEGTDRGRPPTIVEKCIATIDQRGLDVEGIFRISGRHSSVQKMVQDIELDEEKFEFEEKDDIFGISNVLKQYLRELPEPVFHLTHAERVKYTENRELHISSDFHALRARLRRLPPIHQTTFQAVIEHLSRVTVNVAQTKMDAKNVSVVFNSVLFGQDQLPTDGNILQYTQEKDTVLEDLITHCDLLFAAESPNHAPGILPPGSGFTRSGAIPFQPVNDGPQPGSSRTRFRITSPNRINVPIPAEDSPIEQSTRRSPIQEGETEAQSAQIPLSERKESFSTAREEPVEPLSAFTPDDELDFLFDAKVIPQSMRDALDADLHVRPLAATDLMRSHFGLLATLTIAPPIAPSIYTALFNHLRACPETYYIVVIVSRKTDQLVAHGTVMLERKFIHGGSASGHIEDIVVSPDMRGRGLGQVLIKGLTDLAVGLGCYKVILDCKEDRIPFYLKCGFEARSRGMAFYRSQADATPGVSPNLSPSAPPVHTSAMKHGSHLALPELHASRSPSPSAHLELSTESSIPVTQGRISRSSSPGGSSSTSSVTYQYPTATDPPPLPARANEGMGGSELKSPPKRTLVLPGAGEILRGRAPLPPGAAPAVVSGEPARLGSNR